jgi:hypothetical protein
MFEKISIRFFHPVLNLGIADIRNVWYLTNPPVKLKTELHRGSLVFRLHGSNKRVSYRTIKKGLIKKKMIIRLPVQLLPF